MAGAKILSMVVENLHFLDSLNFLPMSLKNMHNPFDLTCKKGYYSPFFNRPRILTMLALILNPSNMGKTTYRAMSETNFWNGTRSKMRKFSAISRSSWPTALTMSIS